MLTASNRTFVTDAWSALMLGTSGRRARCLSFLSGSFRPVIAIIPLLQDTTSEYQSHAHCEQDTVQVVTT